MPLYKLTVKSESVYYAETDSEERARQLVLGGWLDSTASNEEESTNEVTSIEEVLEEH